MAVPVLLCVITTFHCYLGPQQSGMVNFEHSGDIREHGITFPAAEETDGIGVDVGTEKGGGSTRTQGAGREEEGIDAGGVGESSSTVAEGVGDMLGLDGVPALVERIEVLVERSVGRSFGALEALGDDAAGVMVAFETESKLPAVIFGDTATSRSGQYMRLADSAASVLVDRSFDVPRVGRQRRRKSWTAVRNR